MARYYGTLQGTHGTQITRTGTTRSGLMAIAATRSRCVRVEITPTSTDAQTDNVRITVEPWLDSNAATVVLYDGPISALEP